MKDWILHLLKSLAVHARDAAQKVRGELPGHLAAAVIVEAVITGDPAWVGGAAFLLVTLYLLRR